MFIWFIERLNSDVESSEQWDEPKLFNFKVKFAESGYNISQSQDITQGLLAIDYKHKTEIRKNWDKQYDVVVTASNKELEAEWKWTPAETN